MSPAPVVQLTESAIQLTAANNSLLLTDIGGLLSGTTTADFSSGLATFSNLDFTAGTSSDTLTATLALNSSQNLTAISNTFAVTAPAPTNFAVSTIANPIDINVPFTITVAALLPSGTADTLYNGSVSFSSSDPGFVNPGPLTLSSGSGQTTVTLTTGGTQDHYSHGYVRRCVGGNRDLSEGDCAAAPNRRPARLPFPHRLLLKRHSTSQ